MQTIVPDIKTSGDAGQTFKTDIDPKQDKSVPNLIPIVNTAQVNQGLLLLDCINDL